MYFPLLDIESFKVSHIYITFYNIFRNSGIASRPMRYHGQSSTFEEWYVRRRWYHHRCNRSSCPVGTRGGVIASWIHGARWKSYHSWYPLSHGHFCRSQEIGKGKRKMKNCQHVLLISPSDLVWKGFSRQLSNCSCQEFFKGVVLLLQRSIYMDSQGQ